MNHILTDAEIIAIYDAHGWKGRIGFPRAIEAAVLEKAAPQSPVAPADERGRLMQWHGGAGLLWDVYAFGTWQKSIVSPLNWDAHAVYLDMQRAGYSKNVELRLVSSSNNANPDAPTPPTSAADAVDAARYRWLRDESPLCLSDGNHDDPEFTNITDAAIDAAIAASKGTT